MSDIQQDVDLIALSAAAKVLPVFEEQEWEHHDGAPTLESLTGLFKYLVERVSEDEETFFCSTGRLRVCKEEDGITLALEVGHIPAYEYPTEF